jgi:hypothetical protein
VCVWVHEYTHQPNIPSQVALPGGGHSTPIHDDAATTESLRILVAPKDIQDLFDLQLQQIAIRCGYKTAENYLTLALGGVMYDFTLTFHSGHTIHARPGFTTGLLGWQVWDLELNAHALVYYLEEARPSGTQLPMTGVVQGPGDCMGRTEEARIRVSNGAILPNPPSADTKQMRIVATMQGGLPPIKVKPALRPSSSSSATYTGEGSIHGGPGTSPSTAKSQSTLTSSSPSTSSSSSSVPVLVKLEPLPAPTAAGPKKQPKRASSRRPTKKAASSTSDQGESGGVMVQVAYGGLPQVGETLFHGLGRQSKYQPTKVRSLYFNFVEVDALQPTDSSDAAAIRVQNGTAFNVKLPPLDDRVINVRVLAVGEIRGKQESSTKYRAAILQRKCAFDTSWGPLETLDASALPDEAHCEVRTHTHAYA